MNADWPQTPEDPQYAGMIAPLYLEPMPGSGERFTVSVIVCSHDGAVRIETTVSPAALRCLYGAKADNFRGLVDLCEQSLRGYLTEHPKQPNLESWEPPITTAAIGTPRQAFSTSMKGLVSQAVRTYASLGILPNEAEEISDVDRPEDEIQGDWERDIRKIMQNERPQLLAYLRRSVRLTESSKRTTAIGFLHTRYAANFRVLRPGAQIGQHVNLAKAGLWNLQALRSAPEVQFHGDAELVIGHASFESDPSLTKKAKETITDAVEELREEATRHDLSMKVVHNAAGAVSHVSSKVA